ncbi:MAG: histidine kinase [Prevotellaceae bacterium]|jgi:hypothetical protein|nr:histidine kinase [Prevotellaceae bacterium]
MWKRKYTPHPYGHKVAWRLSVLISLILGIIMVVGFLYAKAQDLGRGVNVLDLARTNTLIEFLVNTVMFYLLFRYQFWVIRNYKNRQRVIFIFAGSLLLILMLSPAFAKLQMWLAGDEASLPPNVHLTMNFFKDLVVLVIVFLLTALTFIWEQRQKTLLENHKLLSENMKNRYEVLKNQVDPHFLFNSLNTLNGLIGYDDEKAHEYVDQLSAVFRYTMQSKEVLPLNEELDFALSYVYLMKIRYNESIKVTCNVDEKYLKYYILPCGLQLLLENAVKHNIISNKYPLEIIIETTGRDSIAVRNNIRLKPEVERGGGVGLANLNERYLLLFRKEILITESENMFRVEVPLIKELSKNNRITIHQNESCYC